ncbi:MAG: hypothetical protein V3W41_15825 [Planctomycetota bacterium]
MNRFATSFLLCAALFLVGCSRDEEDAKTRPNFGTIAGSYSLDVVATKKNVDVIALGNSAELRSISLDARERRAEELKRIVESVAARLVLRPTGEYQFDLDIPGENPTNLKGQYRLRGDKVQLLSGGQANALKSTKLEGTIRGDKIEIYVYVKPVVLFVFERQ